MIQNRLPKWLQKNDEVALPAYNKTWFGTDYLEKTVKNINDILSEDTESVTLSRYHGWLQQVEPHLKSIGMMALLIAAASSKSIVVLGVFNVLIVGMALQSGLQLKAFAIRVWIPTLLFTGLAVVPGTINWVTPGETMYTIYAGLDWNIGKFALPTALTVTKQGVQSVFFVILRSGASLGLATLLIKTTRWTLLLKVLAKFGLSTVVITILDVTYRYLYLFLLLLMDYLMGRKSRLVGVETQVSKISWIGGTISDFLRLIKEYSQDIQYAMQSRGYSGEHYPELHIKIQILDIFFLLVVIVLCYYAYGGSSDVGIFSV